MSVDLLKSLRLLSDGTRLRLLLLLRREELSVAELQGILAKGQSQISTQLSQLRAAGLVLDRREGKNIFYRLTPEQGGAVAALSPLLEAAAAAIPEARDDAAALQLTLDKRRERVRHYFDEMAGRFGRAYVPGRSWKGWAEALLALLPPLVIADLGAGEGTFSQLLAPRAKQVIAIDSAPKMVELGSELARQHCLRNLEYRCGDLEDLPVADASVDVALFSQSLHHATHPERAVGEAWRILQPEGKLLILDLVRHQFEQARDLYADVWLGFTEVELRRFLQVAGFVDIQSGVVHRETESPHFETLLVTARKAARKP